MVQRVQSIKWHLEEEPRATPRLPHPFTDSQRALSARTPQVSMRGRRGSKMPAPPPQPLKKRTLISQLASSPLAISALIFISLSLSNKLVTCNADRPPSRLVGATPTQDEPAGQNGGGGGGKEPFECEVFADYGKNYLTPVDVVVKNGEDNVACIKARFALSIKVEEAFMLTPRAAMIATVATPAATPTNATAPAKRPLNDNTIRSVLGYLPLEHVLSVEDSCPSIKKPPPPAGANGTTAAPAVEQPDELEMIVTFGCGKLSFTFRRDKARIFVSSIKGVVKLDKKVVREFVSLRPTFLTSDLEHHFKYDDIIEVASEAQSKTYILTANFYFTEIEAFRTTTSRDFIQPPDEHSKPFSDETPPAYVEPLAAVAKGAQKNQELGPATTQQPPPATQEKT